MPHRLNKYAEPTFALVLSLLDEASKEENKLDKYLNNLSKEVFNEFKELLLKMEKQGKIDLNYPITRRRTPEIYKELQRLKKEQWKRLDDYRWASEQALKEILIDSCVKTFQETYQIFNYKVSIDPYYIFELPVGIPNLKDCIKVRDTHIYEHYLAVPWCQDGKIYSDRLYGNVANFKSKLAFILDEGINKGKGMDWMESSWRKLTGSTAYATARLLKTEVMAMWSRTTKESYLDMGIQYIEIIGDAVCGGICLDYMGEPIKLDEATIGDTLPPYHPNCACSYVAWEEAVPEDSDNDE